MGLSKGAILGWRSASEAGEAGDAKRSHTGQMAPSPAGPAVGSMHKIGALCGLSACNGWTFSRSENEGRLSPIDDLRATMARSERRRPQKRFR